MKCIQKALGGAWFKKTGLTALFLTCLYVTPSMAQEVVGVSVKGLAEGVGTATQTETPTKRAEQKPTKAIEAALGNAAPLKQSPIAEAWLATTQAYLLAAMTNGLATLTITSMVSQSIPATIPTTAPNITVNCG